MNHPRIPVLVLLLAFPALACFPLSLGRPSASETAIAAKVMTEIAATVIPVAPTAVPTIAPTATGVPSQTPDLGAAETATAEALLAPVRSALANYGISPDQGRLGWTHPTKTIELKTFHGANYATDFPNVVARDFVVQADVTWLTSTGAAGCGFVFRADESRTFYGMGVFRGAEGVAAFNEWRKGEEADWQRFRDAPTIRSGNGETNTLAVVAEASRFRLYVNGQLTDQVTNPDLALGAVAFAAFSESGTTICTFNNGWLWILD